MHIFLSETEVHYFHLFLIIAPLSKMPTQYVCIIPPFKSLQTHCGQYSVLKPVESAPEHQNEHVDENRTQKKKVRKDMNELKSPPCYVLAKALSAELQSMYSDKRRGRLSWTTLYI